MEVTHATRALRARIRSTVSPAHALQASEDQHVVRVSNFPDVKGEMRKGDFSVIMDRHSVYGRPDCNLFFY